MTPPDPAADPTQGTHTAGERPGPARSGRFRGSGNERMSIGDLWAATRPILLGIVVGLSVLWGALPIVLWRAKPDNRQARDALRLLPDVVRLVRRLAADPELPRGVRLRLVLLLIYPAIPIDLVPDFIPVIGYADDAIIVALTLRSVARRAGPQALDKHWPGTPDGLDVIRRLARLPSPQGPLRRGRGQSSTCSARPQRRRRSGRG